MNLRMLSVLLGLLALLPGAPGQTYTRKDGITLKEDVIIIDVASIVPDSAGKPVTSTLAACESYCSITLGCTSYDYCESAKGCGTSCISYTEANPALPKNPAMINSPNPAWTVPMTGFGPFGSSAKCVGDAWPNYHCGLKKTATPGKPVWWDMPVTAGYTSGYLPALPTDCAGLTARACYACQKLPTPSAIAGCLACAKAAKVDQYKTIYNGPSVNSRAETCAACYAAGVANPAGCTACLAKSTDDTGLNCVTEGAAASPSPLANKPTAAPPPKSNSFVLPPSAAPPPATVTPRDTQGQGASVPLIPIVVAAIAGVLVLAAIIAAVVIYRRRHEAPKFNNPTFDPAAGVEPYAGGAYAGGGYAGSMGYSATHPGSSPFVGSPAPSDAGGNLQWASSAAAPSVTSSAHTRI